MEPLQQNLEKVIYKETTNNRNNNSQIKKSKEKLMKVIIIIFLSIILFFIKDKIFEDKQMKYKNIKVGMCTIAKKENRYIKYFVEFYKKLGYNHIYFYDNNEPGDEEISDLEIVKDGIKEGFITIIKYLRKIKRIVPKSYYDCYEKYNLDYDWISFFDIDEYLIFEPKNISIQEFLSNPRYDNCDSVKINWRVFSDNNELDYIDKPLMERFPIETKYEFENRHVKSILRGKLNYKELIRNDSPHSIYNNIKACSCSGIKTDWNYYLWPPDFKYASLNHYETKSVTEYFFKKFKTKINVDMIPEKTKKYLFDYFFRLNIKTKIKVDIFNKIFHTNYK